MLKVGDLAPQFSLLDSDHNTVSLKSLKGRYVVLYFYPKDDTPGCTLEGIEFTKLKPAFEKKNAVVLGVSKDSVASHHAFCGKHGLSITLLSDSEGKVVEDYGVWREKKNYGKTFMGIVRSTFLIDPNGKIAKIWDNVKAEGHALEVLDHIG